MIDYKKMYLSMFKATETAIELLVKAQQEAEELYMSQEDAEVEE